MSVNDRRLDEEAVLERPSVEDASSIEDLPATPLRELDGGAILRHGVLVDYRPKEHVPLRRVPDRELLRLLDEARKELPLDALVHDHAGGRGALLPAIAEGGPDHAGDGLLEGRGSGHACGVL